jgi:hypothetical protein
MDLNTPDSPEITEPINPRKRQRENEPKVPVTLSRDKLLNMTSKEIEDYVSELKTKRTLTAAEEKDLKKQRRLVKNREYASQSRSRKKLFVDELEKQLEQARAETEEVKKQNKALMDENKLLKRQLGCIADTIKKAQLNNGSNKDSASLSASSGCGLQLIRQAQGGSRKDTSSRHKGGLSMPPRNLLHGLHVCCLLGQRVQLLQRPRTYLPPTRRLVLCR